jgi:acetoin utilization protein AcuC
VAVMSVSVGARLMWDSGVTGYDFGPGHPMDPVRLRLTMRLVEAFGLDKRIEVAGAKPADEAVLELVHEADYVQAVRRASLDPQGADVLRGLGTPDTPAFAGMHEVSALIAGLSVGGAEFIWSEGSEGSEGGAHAVNFSGGLHHAMPGAASGFCVYNDAALAIARLLELGARRVAYLDLDVHHGDGVQAAFWNDPRVLTISVHEDPRTLFPGTGRPGESGGAEAPGCAVNLALPPGTGDAAWLRAVHAIVPELLADFGPEVLVSQHGADTHVDDPLAHLALSVDAQRAAAEAAHGWAHEYAGGRWLALGGGGYAVVDVVPRTWAHVVAIAAHAPIVPETPVPEEFSRGVYALTRQAGPRRMTDGAAPRWQPWEAGYDPGEAVDQAILATRRAVYPVHGLLP